MQPRAISYRALATYLATASASQRQLRDKLAKFLVVGGSGVIVNMVTLVTLYQFGHLPLALSSALAVEVSILNNFIWNNHWTFGQHSLSPSRFAKFNLVSLAGLVVTTTTVWLLSSTFGMHYVLANIVGIGLASVWNFSVNLVWTWGRE